MAPSHRLWKVAHRGASAEAPENTPAAFALAIEQGADVIECDVRRTGDGGLLILHDAEVDRTTSGSGALRAMTAVEARALDAGDGQAMPTLAEILDLARGRVRVNVDIKEADVVEASLDAVRDAGMLESVTFISFLPEVWEQLDRLTPESPRIHLVDSAAALASLAMGEGVTGSVAAGVGVHHDLVNEGMVAHMHRHGVAVFAWTVDAPDEMRRLIDCDVNGIVTNRPAALVEIARGLSPTRVGELGQ